MPKRDSDYLDYVKVMNENSLVMIEWFDDDENGGINDLAVMILCKQLLFLREPFVYMSPLLIFHQFLFSKSRHACYKHYTVHQMQKELS